MQDIDRRELVIGIAGTSILGFPVDRAALPAVAAPSSEGRRRDIANVRDFGAVGDGASDDTRFLQAALDSGSSTIVLPQGQYRTGALTVPAGVEFYGTGTLLLINGGLTLRGNNAVRGMTLKGIANSGLANAISVSGSANAVIDGVRFVSITRNAVDILDAVNVQVRNCTAYDIGRYSKIDPRREGCFVHVERSRGIMVCQNPDVQRTYGHAAIFIRENNTDCSVCDNAISDTFFRAIQIYSTGIARVVVNGNRIHRTGEINNTGSGVGCNGIYVVTGSTDPSLVAVSHNHIEKCGENGIEVLGAATVLNNVIKITGYRNLKTPSKEGIFVESGAIVKNNLVVAPADRGIRHFSNEPTRDMVIDGNVIIDAGSDGINLQTDGETGRYVNCRITNNQIMSHKGGWSIAFNGTNGALVDETNVVSGNIVPHMAKAFVAKGARTFGNSWQF